MEQALASGIQPAVPYTQTVTSGYLGLSPMATPVLKPLPPDHSGWDPKGVFVHA